MRNWLPAAGLLLSLALMPPAPPAKLEVLKNEAAVEFPDRITFAVELQSDVEIARVILEYGVANQLTCGEVAAKAFPAVTPGKNISASWTWEMRQSGSEPPGSELWWQWRVIDSAGNEQLTEKQTVAWLDSRHPWQTLTGGAINLHWYAGGQSLGETLHDSAIQSLDDLEDSTGLKPDSPIDLYIYGSTEDMREAVLYEPGWTGGQAYSDYSIVIIGVSPDQIDWGRRAQAHELTHVLVGHLTFSCLGGVPTWLNEGLAVYGEGGPDEFNMQQLREAIAADTLMPVRALSGGFSEDPGQADLSYSESYSLVNFLIETYGRDKMLDLLRALRDGETADEAMLRLYGFDVDGFEDAWRANVGAAPRAAVVLTPASTPTPVPTFAPISNAPVNPTLFPTLTAQPTLGPTPDVDAGALPWMAGALAACAAALCFATLVAAAAVFALRGRR